MTELLPGRTNAPVAAPAGEPWRQRLRTGPGPGGWLATLAVTLLAGLLRFVRLDLPYAEGTRGKVFDEIYYACDAENLLRYGVEHATLSDPDDAAVAGSCTPTGGGAFVVHPSLGKWAIALGMKAFGVTPVGWRSAAALAGTLTVLVVVRAGRRLTGSTLLGCLAGLLLALDGLHLVQSRIAMLDVFLGLFVVTAVWLVVEDARRRQQAPGGLRAALLGSRWRWVAGLVLGLAVATKWSGLLAVLAGGLLVVGAEAWLPASSWRQRLARVLAAVAGMVVSFLVLPFLVHLASYAGFFANYEESYAGAKACGDAVACDHGALERLDTWWGFQGELVRYHQDLEATHSYRSSPAGWPLLLRPVLQYREGCPSSGTLEDRPCVVEPGEKAEILGVGNPAIWWPALLAYPLLAWRAVRRRDPAAGAVLVVLLSLWLPWFAAGKPGYLFYLVPAVPFVALALAVVLGAVRRPRLRTGAMVGLAVLAVVVFAFFYPVLTGAPLSPGGLSVRHWLPSWG